MPVEPITVIASVETARLSLPTYGVVGIIGDSGTGTATVETAYTVYTLANAGILFGSSGALYNAAKAAFDQGVTSVVMIEASGTTTTAYDNAYAKLAEEDVDICSLAGYIVDPDNDYDLVKNHASACGLYNWVTVLHSDLNDVDQADLITAVADFDSKRVAFLAAKNTTDEVGAAMCARLGVIQPWNKMGWKEVAEIDSDRILNADVDTLETGKVNAVIQIAGRDYASDGLTTLGGSYKFIDITRTEDYIASEIKYALKNMQFGELPYTTAGLASVRNAIAAVLDRTITAGAITVYTVQVPTIDQISPADKQNRVLNDVLVSATLAGHIQTITLRLTLQI